jgi:hypothetical protein
MFSIIAAQSDYVHADYYVPDYLTAFTKLPEVPDVKRPPGGRTYLASKVSVMTPKRSLFIVGKILNPMKRIEASFSSGRIAWNAGRQFHGVRL